MFFVTELYWSNMGVLDFSKMTTLFGDVLRFLGRLKRSGLVKHFWDMTIWPSSVRCFLFCLFWKLQWQTGYLLCGMSLFPHILKLKFYMVYKWSPHHCLLTLPHSRKQNKTKTKIKQYIPSKKSTMRSASASTLNRTFGLNLHRIQPK